MDGQLDPVTVSKIKNRCKAFLEEQQGLPRGQWITRSKLAASVGVAKSTLSQCLGGSYPRSKEDGFRKRDEVLVKVDQYLNVCESQQQAPQRGEHAWTRLAEDIRAVANAAMRTKSIGAVRGPAGCGKAVSLEVPPHEAEQVVRQLHTAYDDEGYKPAIETKYHPATGRLWIWTWQAMHCLARGKAG